MSAADFAELDRWFNALVDLDPHARDAKLAPLDTTDPDLAARVRAMLAAATGSDRRLRAAVGGAVDDFVEAVPERIGPFRVLRRLGSGGMGAVYLCQRADGDFVQLLAVKRIGASSGQAWARERLRHERRVLAALRHPHIAQLIDGGDDADGTPYVAMEFVDGMPIDRYAAERRLDRRARVILFLDLCAAVQFAHRNLVVHRDIKPANVLVDAHGQLKLLDFGIAKLLDDVVVAGATAPPTVAGAMTPQYASPEQVRGDPVSQASDIYSLGVVLYDLLAGRRPYAIETLRPSEVERVVCETDPPPPCATAGDRGATGADLDCIVMHALHKEPDRRYASAAQFAQDLKNWLDGRVIQARPDTNRYRLGRFVRRHPLGVGMTTLLAALVIAFAATMAWQSRRLARERDVAAREALVAKESADFLVGLFAAADPKENDAIDVRARDLLDRAAVRLPDALPTDPLARASLMHVIGLAYANLGDDAQGIGLLQAALDLREKHAGGDGAEVADSLNRLGNIHRTYGHYAQAKPMLERALAWRERRGVVDHDLADSYNNLGILQNELGNFGDAEKLLRKSIALHRQAGPPDTSDADAALNNLATALQGQGRLAEARTTALEALDLKRRSGEHPASVAITLARLAEIEAGLGELDAALAHATESLAIRRRTFGDANPMIAGGLVTEAKIRAARGDVEPARTLFEEAMALHAKAREPDTMASANTRLAYGRFLLDHGGHDRGVDLLREARTIAAQHLPAGSPALQPFERAAGDGQASGGPHG
jgi:serine/threonine-protein kinase